MANKTISDLTTAIEVADSDNLLIENDTVTMKASKAVLLQECSKNGHGHEIGEINLLQDTLDSKMNNIELANVATSGSYADLSDTPKIPTKVSELENDNGYLTAVPSTYVTEQELAAELLQKSDIDHIHKYEEITDVPTIPTTVAELTDKDDYVLKANVNYITYESFGAVGDGVNDDGEAIRQAHEFANEKGLSVLGRQNATYLIKGTKNIQIKTNTDLNNATIIIDENYVNNLPIFVFETEKTELTTNELQFLQTSISKDISRFETVTTMNGYVVVVEDKNTVICNRELNSSVEEQTYKEVFAVDNSGSLQCINYDNPNNRGATITEGVKYKIPSSYITFKNVNFVLSGSSSSTYNSYHRYILIERSLVNIENISVTVNNDMGTIQRMFFRNQNTYGVNFKNINGCDFNNQTNYSSSTYLFSNMNTVSAKYENINTPIYNPDFWGCFQSFYSKNLTLRDSNISRFDSHFYGADINIDNCQFGYKAIQIQGHGKLHITKTSVYSYTFINFRDDYGGSWDGSIHIEDCQLVFRNSSNGTDGSIIRHTNNDTFDYGYDIIIPNIFIKNFTFVKTQNLTNCIAVNLLNTKGTTNSKNIIMPNKIIIDNVISETRFRAINIIGDYIQRDNTYIEVRNCQDIVRPTNIYMATTGFVGINSISNPQNAYSPKIFIENCENVTFCCKNATGELIIQNSTINRINTNDSGGQLKRVRITNCELNPNCSDNPTSGVPINKFNSDNTYLNDVYCKQINVNGVEVTNTNFIKYIGFFNSTYDGVAFKTMNVVLNNTIAGYSNLDATLLEKLLFNIVI